jgi:hypothetical protein
MANRKPIPIALLNPISGGTLKMYEYAIVPGINIPEITSANILIFFQ